MPECFEMALSQDCATTLAAHESLLPVKEEEVFGLHMEASYILDCSVELGEITPLEARVFTVKNPAAMAFKQLMDRDEQLPPHWLRNTARQYLECLPLEERYVWALRGIEGVEFGMQMFQERVEFMIQTKVQSDLGIDERVSIRWMDEGTEDVFSDKVFTTVHDVTQDQVQAFVSKHYGEAKARLEENLVLMQEAVKWVSLPGNQARAREIALRLFQEVPRISEEPPALTPRQLASRAVTEKRKNQRRARSAIKKALKLFSRTGLEGSVRMMVQGQEVELSHPASPFKFVLQPLQAGWLEQKTIAPGGHVPYQLTLLTKEGVFLSRLCVLFDQTPVLDQLLALTFFVQSGNEQELLSKANWFGYESATSVRQVLAEKAPALLDRIPEGGKGRLGGLFAHSRTEEHWAPYKGPVKNWIANWMGGLQLACRQLSQPAFA